jgi:hypothetical protein
VKRKRETLKQKKKKKKKKEKKNQLGLDHFLAVRLDLVSYCSQFARPNEQRTSPSTFAHATVAAPSFDVAAENNPRISHRRRYVAAPATDLQRNLFDFQGKCGTQAPEHRLLCCCCCRWCFIPLFFQFGVWIDDFR